MYSIELTITNIPDDCVKIICSRLDRPEREVLRCTSKKYFQLILSQDELNKNYVQAHKQQDKLNITYWKSLGGWLPYQEFANAIKDERESLATWLLKQNKVAVEDAYCCNIQEAAETSTIKQIRPVLKWLLDTRSTRMFGEYLSGYNCAKNLKEKYPNAQEIIDFFDAYMKQEDSRTKNYYLGGSGLAHFFSPSSM
jgi:hypothetical protein